MKKIETFALRAVIQSIMNPGKKEDLTGRSYNPAFSYALAKNLRKLNDEIKDLEASRKRPVGWDKFEHEKNLLLEKYAIIDRGTYLIRPDGYPECGTNQEKFIAEFKLLEEKNKEMVLENEKYTTEWETFLNEESTMDLHKVKIASIPTYVTDSQLNALFEMLEE